MHKIQIVYDEETGKIVANQRATVKIGDHTVSHSREIELEDSAVEALKAILDVNREIIQGEAMELGIQHVAAVTGKKQKGVTPLKVGGGMGGIGASETKKGDA